MEEAKKFHVVIQPKEIGIMAKRISRGAMEEAKKFHVVIQPKEIGIFNKQKVYEVFDPLRTNISVTTYSDSNKELISAIRIVAEKAGHAAVPNFSKGLHKVSGGKDIDDFMEIERKKKQDEIDR